MSEFQQPTPAMACASHVMPGAAKNLSIPGWDFSLRSTFPPQ